VKTNRPITWKQIPPVVPDANVHCQRRAGIARWTGAFSRIGARLLAAACLSTVAARAQIADSWTSTSSGLWGTSGNWSAGVPTNANAATFNSTAGLGTAITMAASSTTGSLVFASAGGANAYTFDTLGTENANTLAISSGITNSDAAAITFYNAMALGATQTWTNNGGTMAFNGNVSLGSGSSGYGLTVNGTGAVNIGGVISDGGSAPGSLTYAGTATLTLTGANTYTGATAITSGTLNIQNAGALGTASNTSSITVASDATIYSSTPGYMLTIGNSSGTNLFSLGSNTITFDGPGNTFVYSNLGVAGDTGGLVKNGTGTLTLWGFDSYYTGATTVNAGTLDLVVGPFSSGWYGVNGPLTIGTGPANPALAGTVSVNIESDSYGDQISPTSAVTINSDGVLNVASSTSLGALTLNGGQMNISGGVTVTANGTVASYANSAHETSLISGGTLNLTTGNISVSRDSTLASDLTITSQIGGTNLTKSGNGILTLAGSNSYSGATNLNGGTLSISADANLGAAPGSPTPAKLNFNGGTLASTASLTLNSNRGISVNAAGGTVSVAPGTTLTFGGLVAGSGNLSVPSAGTLNLTNNSLNFGGSAAVASGELEFSGTLPSIGTLTLNSGSTLYLSGSDLSVTNLVIGGNAIIDCGSSASILNATNLTLGAGATLTVMDWSNEIDYFYAQNWTGATLGTTGAGSETQVSFAGYTSSSTGWLSYDNEVSPAPEPATYGAIMAGISLVAIAVYRRKRSTA
jgi:autotransporter-associated beta strand protein